MNISVSLPEDLEQFVEQKIATGRYSSSSDVIGEALRLLETVEHQAVDSLRKAWQDGIESGDAGELNFAELKAEARARLAAAKA